MSENSSSTSFPAPAAPTDPAPTTMEKAAQADMQVMSEIMRALAGIAEVVNAGSLKLNKDELDMATKVELTLRRTGAIYEAILKCHERLNTDIGPALANLCARVEDRISLIELTARKLLVGLDPDCPGPVAADRLFMANGWAFHLATWIENAKLALKKYMLRYHERFVELKKEIAGHSEFYWFAFFEKEDNHGEHRAVLFALDLCSINLKTDWQEIGAPEIPALPLSIELARGLEVGGEEEKAMQMEATKILEACYDAVRFN